MISNLERYIPLYENYLQTQDRRAFVKGINTFEDLYLSHNSLPYLELINQTDKVDSLGIHLNGYSSIIISLLSE
jgi:hypothetical protein